MKFNQAITVMLLVGLLAGCAGASVGLRTEASSPVRASAAPFASSTSAVSIQAHASSNAYIGVIFLAPLIFGSDDYLRLSGEAPGRRAPDMVEGRAIAERDCSRPLGQVEGNLRCK